MAVSVFTSVTNMDIFTAVDTIDIDSFSDSDTVAVSHSGTERAVIFRL